MNVFLIHLMLYLIFIWSALSKHNIFEDKVSRFSNNSKRRLESYSTPELAQVSGNGTSNFTALDQVEVTVATYDCYNNALTSGSANLRLEVSEYDTSSTLLSTTNYSFVNNNDGTYTVNFTASQEGSILYNIYINDTCTACTYYWTNMDLQGDYQYFCDYEDLNRSYENGLIFYNYYDYVSSRILAKIVAPQTATYNFTWEQDDGCI